MLRLSTPDYKRFVQADSFDVTYGGGEANVAAALCNYGLNGTFVTKVPNNPIGQSAINHLRRYGVDTQFIARGGERLGIYFLETGASMRASQVVYDRAGASIADVNPEEFDWDKILAGADWFHTTGITPALSDKAAALTEAALKAQAPNNAHNHTGTTIRLDMETTDPILASGILCSIIIPTKYQSGHTELHQTTTK